MRPFDPFQDIGLITDIAAIVFAICGAILAWIKLHKAPSWPTGQGMVMSTWSGRRESGRGWACYLTYSYVADNEYYSGTFSMKARNEKHADELVSMWKGHTIIVRYSQGDHGVSAVLRDDQVGRFGN